MKEKIENLMQEAEINLKDIYYKYDKIEEENSIKVLKAFKENNVNEACFNMTTGYGYSDLGRDTIEKVYSDIFKSEDSLVRSQFISGTHALTTALFACLRPGDTLLSITGKPYDTLEEVIGIQENDSSLKSYGINYQQIDLIDNHFNIPEIQKVLKEKKIKLIEIQRSKGYSTRKSILIEDLEEVIKQIREVDA